MPKYTLDSSVHGSLNEVLHVPRTIYALLFLACLTSCVATIRRTSNSFFSEYPVAWDARTRAALREQVGYDGPFEVGVFGVSKRSARLQVTQFLRTLHRKTVFNRRGDDIGASFLQQVGNDEEYVEVYRKDIFELEPLASAMVRSGLFTHVHIDYGDGKGGGLGSEVVVDRTAFFDNPKRPSNSQVLPKLEKFFVDYFHSKNQNAVVSVVPDKPDDYEFAVRVKGLHNLILEDSDYWEEAEIYVRIYPRLGMEKQGLMVNFITQGRYASGIGTVPPPPRKYKSMESSWETSWSVHVWTEAMAADFLKYFTKPRRAVP
jgi:hypothetical protein